MILPITDFSLYLAENNVSGNIPTWIVVLVSAVLFVAATVIGGLFGYRIKLKKLREKALDDKSDSESERR